MLDLWFQHPICMPVCVLWFSCAQAGQKLQLLKDCCTEEAISNNLYHHVPGDPHCLPPPRVHPSSPCNAVSGSPDLGGLKENL